MNRPGVASDPSTDRRSFLRTLTGVGVATMGALLSVPLFRFAFYPMFVKTSGTGWSDLGSMEEIERLTFPAKRTIRVEQLDGWRKVVSEKAAFIVKAPDGTLRVLSPVCPHLGCMIGWDPAKQRFVSPCHNGIFSPDGSLISGPPRRSMDELETKIEQGHLLIRYQYFQPLIATKDAVA
jgi:menaquinol-cytochrome c reductase iron-sulfur subunit